MRRRTCSDIEGAGLEVGDVVLASFISLVEGSVIEVGPSCWRDAVALLMYRREHRGWC